jgi:hypothetical protein
MARLMISVWAWAHDMLHIWEALSPHFSMAFVILHAISLNSLHIISHSHLIL